MKHLFEADNPVMQVLSMAADLILLNLLWLVCCIPVVTIGASTTAMYAVALKLAKGDDGYILKRFFKAFKQNFRQATVINLVVCVLAVLLAVNYYSCMFNENISQNMLILLVAITGFMSMFLSWFYPILAQFDNSIKNTCKNTVAMAVVHLPFTIQITVLNLLSLVLCLIFTDLFLRWMFIWILVGGSAIAYVNSFSLNYCFRRYIPQENSVTYN